MDEYNEKKEDKRILNIFMFTIFAALIVISLYLSYMLYLNTYSEQEQFRINYPNTSLDENMFKSYSGELQFSKNMRFSSSRLSYSIMADCPEEKKNDMLMAFEYLHNRVPVLSFYQRNSDSDIEIKCGEEYREGESLVAGEGGPKSYVNTSLFSVVSKGEILLLYSKTCKDNYNIPLHELLHVFGFNHSANPKSIMYEISSCDQVVTDDIINEIKRLYSIEALPDLYFTEVYAAKKGSYAAINFTVRNQGLIKSENITVSAFFGSQEEDFELEGIDVGAGKMFLSRNIKVPIGTQEIKLQIIDGEEISEDNNAVFLELE